MSHSGVLFLSVLNATIIEMRHRRCDLKKSDPKKIPLNSKIQCLKVGRMLNLDENPLSHHNGISVEFRNVSTSRHCISELRWNFLYRIVLNHIYDVYSQ